jgi:non-ribosomal peptide synthetase component E (peptide arylation enzyme)
VTPLEVLRRYQVHDYTLLGVLAGRARAIPEHSFMEFGDARLTYSQTLARVHEAMALFAAKGVKPGDRRRQPSSSSSRWHRSARSWWA